MKKLNVLRPALKDYLWGGTRLKEEYNKGGEGMDIVAESWELSSHPDGYSYIGETDLYTFVQQHPEVLGTKCPVKDVPLLIKFIDAKGALSIQVHPDDEFARKYENDNGKTEMWYIADALEDSYLYLGVKEAISKEEFERKINDFTVTDCLNKIPVKKGDVFLVKAGTLHAIGEGCLIVEIQERSNVTYRVYDFGRRDKNGNLRELHVEKALKVANLNPVEINGNPDAVLKDDEDAKVVLLKSCEYFTTCALDVRKKAEFEVDEKSFACFTLTKGTCSLHCGEESVELVQGQSVFVPAGAGKVEVTGECEAIVATL